MSVVSMQPLSGNFPEAYLNNGSAAHIYSSPQEDLLAKMALKRSLFLWLYLSIPLAALFVACDYFFLDQHFRKILPLSTDSIKLFVVFFPIPHGISGFFSLADKQYLSAYRYQLLLYPLVVAALFMVEEPVTMAYINLFYVLWTIYHAFAQSSGICRIILGPVSRVYFYCWRYSLVVIHILLVPLTPFCVLYEGQHPALRMILGAAIVVNLFCTWKIKPWIKERFVATLFVCTSLSAYLLPMFFVVGYSFFYPLCGRLIHDISAIAFNSVHDYNRANHKQDGNILYWLFRWTSIPVFLLNPLLAIAVAFFCLNLTDTDFGVRVLMSISLFHYYMETWTWRRGSPNREYIRLSV
ncbi:MAG: hypothetical protein ACXVCY_06175 [Pseudobdellovibrionaceae bacterium]